MIRGRIIEKSAVTSPRRRMQARAGARRGPPIALGLAWKQNSAFVVESALQSKPHHDRIVIQQSRLQMTKLLQLAGVGLMRRFTGLDFGTTNSAIAVASTNDPPVSVLYEDGGGSKTDVFRSILYFELARQGLLKKVKPFVGPDAIKHYLQKEHQGRLIQSIKSYLASPGFRSTNILGTAYTVENLVALIISGLLRAAEKQLGNMEQPIVVGRPVRFAGAETPEHEQIALSRLKGALAKAGVGQFVFEYEPVGAAYYYESRLDHDELILIADFGGGTSDFSVLDVGPSYRKSGPSERSILGNEGIAIAGDAFDAKIVRHVVSPQLGLGSEYRSVQNLLPVPVWMYLKLERWHHLSFLKSKETMEMVKEMRATATMPEMLEALMHIIDQDLGYELHRAVQRTKFELSVHDETLFRFDDYAICIRKKVTRAEFESWIAEELQAIATTVDVLLQRSGVHPSDFDR